MPDVRLDRERVLLSPLQRLFPSNLVHRSFVQGKIWYDEQGIKFNRGIEEESFYKKNKKQKTTHYVLKNNKR